MGHWENWIEEQRVDADKVRPRPKDLSALIEAVERAVADGVRVRAVGSGHSSSAVAKPSEGGRYVDPGRLDRELTWGWYAEGLDASHLVRVEAGMTIEELNDELDDRRRPGGRLAVPVLGSYDGQKIAGVTSTATHGSGLRHKPLSDAVVAIENVVVEMVAGKPEVRVYRIEPTDGVTHRKSFEAAVNKAPTESPLSRYVLEQDDEIFYAAVVGLGCLGITYAVTLRVRDAFWLEETREVSTWAQLKPHLVTRATDPANAEYFDALIFPHPMLEDVGPFQVGDVVCLTHRRVAVPVEDHPPRRNDPKPWADELAGIFGTGILEQVALRRRRSHRRTIAKELAERASPRYARQRSASHVIMKTSLGPEVRATSCEMWLPIDKVCAAIDRILALVVANEVVPPHDLWLTDDVDDRYHWVHSSPIGVRFVGQSSHYLAPSHDGPKATIEIPLLMSTRILSGAERREREQYRMRMLKHLAKELVALGARPHWGQRHFFETKSVREHYPRFDRFEALYRRFNPLQTFSNELSRDVLGLD